MFYFYRTLIAAPATVTASATVSATATATATASAPASPSATFYYSEEDFPSHPFSCPLSRNFIELYIFTILFHF
jgi:hypothetical protein